MSIERLWVKGGGDYGKSGAIPLDIGELSDSSVEPILKRNRSPLQPIFPKGRYIFTFNIYPVTSRKHTRHRGENVRIILRNLLEIEKEKTIQHSPEIIFSHKRMPIYLDYFPWNVSL